MKKYVVGIDLGGTNIKVGIIENGARILNKISAPTGNYKNKKALIDGLAMICLRLVDSSGLNKDDISGIGIGAPGLIDSSRGVIHELVNIKGFKEVPLKRLIEDRTDIPTFLDNDVNVMTLGELYHGAGRGAVNMLCVTLGTGVGGGVVINGKLYRGSSLSAGEIGHMPLNEKGPACGCGGSGCMEKSVGNNYIIRVARESIQAGNKSLITKLVSNNLGKITPEIISAAAKKGDRLAISLWREIGAHLGVTLAGAVNLLNPDMIVIGGGVADAGRVLFDSIRRTVRQRAMKVPARRAKIVKAKLGQDAGLIGAAVLVELNT